jgi:hypothetical protein
MGSFDHLYTNENTKKPSTGSFNHLYTNVKKDDAPVIEEDFTYSKFQESPELRQAAVRFAKDHLGYDNPTAEKAIDETIEHFREFNVNEMVAAGDWGYVSGLKTDGKQEQLEDYRKLYQAFDALPAFYESGGAPSAFLDYAAGIAQAPSTYAGILLPGAGKAAGIIGQTTAKLAIGRALAEATKTPVRSLATTAAIEGTAALAGDISAQKALMEADVQDEYSLAQTGLAVGIATALPVAAGGVLIKKKAVDYIERNTEDLVTISQEAIKKRVDKANRAADASKQKNTDGFNIVEQNLNRLNEEAVAKGKEILGEAAETSGIDSPIRLAVQPEKMKQVTAALTDILATQGGLQKGERITEGIHRVLKSLDEKNMPKEVGKVFDDTLVKYNLTFDDLANVIMADVSDSARLLQQMGQAKVDLKAKLGNFSRALDGIADFDLFGFDIEVREAAKRAREAVDENDVRAYVEEIGVARQVDAARLAFMTSQTATTVRNVVSGAARVGFDTITRAVDVGLRKATGKKITAAGQDDIFAVFGALTNHKEAVAIENIFAMGFQKEATRLFRMLQDIGDTSAVPNKMTRLGNASRQLNALNTITDNIFKRAALIGNLKRNLNEQYSKVLQDRELFEEFGKKFGRNPTEDDFNLVEIIKNGRFNDVFGSKSGQETLSKAIDEALYFTYQKQPDDILGKTLINAIHRVPFVGTGIMPFPRFIINALRHTYEYSPVYFLNPFEKGSRAARKEILNVYKPLVGMSRDETITSYENAAKGLVGTGFLLGAATYRYLGFGGENWYEGRTPDGRTFDLRPFFPAAPFLFFGDLIAKTYRQNVLGEPQIFKGDKSLVTDALQAITGTQFRTGMGLYTLDALAEEIIGESGDTKFEVGAKIITEWAANTVSTFTIPITFGQDLYNTFLSPDDERIARDLESRDMMSLFINKSLSRIPGNFAIEKKLEEVGITSPFTGEKYKAPPPRKPATKEGLERRITPITRQTTGMLKRERKNVLEKELDRLRIRRSDVYGGRTEIPEYNETYATLLDTFMEDEVIPYIKSDKYKAKNKNPQLQAKMLKTKLRQFKEIVTGALRKQKSTDILVKKYGFSPRDALLFNRLPAVYKTKAKEHYIRVYGEPETEFGYNYRDLYNLGKSYQSAIEKDVRETDPNPIE